MRNRMLCPAYQEFDQPPPPEAVSVPSKMSRDEKSLLYWLAQSSYTGQGVIIDAGTLLGASAKAFAVGLRNNAVFQASAKPLKQPIKSFELGIVHRNMVQFFAKHGVAPSAKPGDSFEPALREYLQPVADLVELKVGDIMKTGGGIEQPIEILFLDVLKTNAINDFALLEYFPKLIPQVSIVIQQDYFFEELWFLKLAQEYFADRFEYQGEVGSSAIFRSVRAISRQEVEEFIANPPPPEEQLRLVSCAIHRSLNPDRRFMCALSKAVLIFKLQGADKAKAYIEYVRSEYPQQCNNASRRLVRALKWTEELTESDDPLF